MPHNQNGFSLVEMLMTIIISSIILAAAFGSYAVINRNFEYQKDMKYISQTARMVVDMINEDVRMAGYKDFNASAIADPVTISDCPGGTGCTQQSGSLDRIAVVYDLSSTTRQRITYYGTVYPATSTDTNRYRLMKRLETCNPSSCNNWTQQYDEPVADYIEELTFSGTRGSCQSGDIKIGCGSRKTVTPIAFTYDQQSNNASGCTADPMLVFDNLPSTYWRCGDERGQFGDSRPVIIKYEFENPIRIISVTGRSLSADRGEGSFSGVWPADTNLTNGNILNGAIEPYGFYHHVDLNLTIIMHDEDPRTCLIEGAGMDICHTGSPVSMPDAGPYKIRPGFFFKTWSIDDPAIFTNSDHFKNWASKFINIRADSQATCAYNNGICSIGYHQSGKILEIPNLTIYAEEFGGPIVPLEVETNVLIRSPNEHGNVDRINNFNSSVDRFLRDRFIGSTVIRNLNYQS